MTSSHARPARTPWSEVEPLLRDRAYRRIDAMPELLLETDSWYLPIRADLYYARLIGYEDEVAKDGLQLSGARPEIYVPIMRRLMVMRPDPVNPWEIEPLPVARYVLQSCFTTCSVSGELYDVPVEQLRPDHTAVVAFLRYRRRS